jgi:hypothetical protein
MRQVDSNPVNNSNVVVPDDTLFFAISGNSSDVFFVESLLIVSSPDPTSDFKLSWSVPSGVTGYHGPLAAASNIGGWVAVNAGTSPGALATSLAGTFSYGTIAGTSGIYHGAEFFVGSTPGNIVLQWAQATAFSGDTKLLKGSFIKINKIQ